MGSQLVGSDSRGLEMGTTQKYGRQWPWLTTSRRSKSCPTLSQDAQTSEGFLDTRYTAADSPLWLALRLPSTKPVETSTPRMGRSSGSTSVRNQVSTSTTSPSALVLQTRLASMPSLALSPGSL